MVLIVDLEVDLRTILTVALLKADLGEEDVDLGVIDSTKTQTVALVERDMVALVIAPMTMVMKVVFTVVEVMEGVVEVDLTIVMMTLQRMRKMVALVGTIEDVVGVVGEDVVFLVIEMGNILGDVGVVSAVEEVVIVMTEMIILVSF